MKFAGNYGVLRIGIVANFELLACVFMFWCIYLVYWVGIYHTINKYNAGIYTGVYIPTLCVMLRQ